ncbi:MAG: hypothetical protein WBX25_33815 [Rhodomicrobium sp.]
MASVDNAVREISEDEKRALMMYPRRSYVVQVVESKVCTRQGETQEVLGLLFEILNGAPPGYGGSKGCHIERYFRVMDEDEPTRAEARSQVSTLMRAVGLDVMQDSEELHDRPFKMHLWRMDFNFPHVVAERFSCESLTHAEIMRLALPALAKSDGGHWAA